MTQKKAKNLIISKKSSNKVPLNALKQVFKNVFSFLQLQLSQNEKSKKIFFLFFQLQGFQFPKKIFLKFFNFTKPQSQKKSFFFFLKTQNLKLKKILYTFLLKFRNLKVAKNPRNLYFEIVRLKRLNDVFITTKTEKLRFLSIFGNKLNYFVK